jgi:DnaJ-class molecular chaperone
MDIACPRGDGAEVITELGPLGQGQPEKYPDGCPLCEGDGWLESECPQCDGTGRMSRGD